MAIVRDTDKASPLTEELQSKLLEALATGLKPRWVAFYCGVSPRTLFAWLDAGAKKDAKQPYRSFAVRWVRAEAELMLTMLTNGQHAFLRERWPHVWGPKAAPDYEAMQPQVSNAEENAQFEAIVADPELFGVEDVFERQGWVRREGWVKPDALP